MQVKEYQTIKNFILNNKLKDIFELKEINLTYSYGKKYTFKFNGKIVNSFEVHIDTYEVDTMALYEYCLGFIDCYIITNRDQVKTNINKKENTI